MRGAENSHLLILLDGVKLNDPTITRGSTNDLSSIDLQQIGRIEVLRGPASAVYGGEALAGVVHIITRRASGRRVSGSGGVAVGGDRHRRLSASIGIGADSVQAQIGAAHAEDGQVADGARLRLDSVNASVRFAPGDAVQAELFASQADRRSDAFPDDSGGPRLAVNRELTTRKSTDQVYGARLGWGDASRVRIDALLSVFDRREHGDNAFVDSGVRFPVPPFVSDTDMQRTNLVVSATHQFAPHGSLVAGLEHQRENAKLRSVGDFYGAGAPQTLEFALKRKTDAVFAEGRVAVGHGVALQLGLRHDKVQGLDAVTTPHLGALWDLPGGGTTLKASVAKGFKPPSFFAMGFPIGGNPRLRPERSRNVELALVQRRDAQGSVAQLSVYRIDYKDLVDFDANTFQNINRGAIVVKGIEPELRWRLAPGWRLQAGATLLEIDERDGLQPLRNRPERRATATLTWDIDAQRSLFVGLNHTGGYLDRSNPTGDIRMPGATLLDAGYAMPPGPATLRFALDNLLDKDHEQFVGFPAEGRRLRVQLRAGF
jgi:outer membrane cobalamin receptor